MLIFKISIMKTKYHYLKIVFCIVIFTIVSCVKDFLNTEPMSFYSPENALVNKDGMEAALAACGDVLRGEYYGLNQWPEYIFSDIGIYGGDDENSGTDLTTIVIPDGTFDVISFIKWDWESWWNMIKYANVIISRIDNATFSSEDEKKAILGEAYFYRAMAYYRLVHQYGDVPLILDEIKSPRLDFYSFTRESILEKMKVDMDLAVQWLPVSCANGRINKAAGYQILTKINLALEKFDDAIASATNIINDGVHSLMTSRFGYFKNQVNLTDGYQAFANGGSVPLDVIWDLNLWENKSVSDNKEAIFVVVDRENIEGNYGGTGSSSGTLAMRCHSPYWNRASVIKTPSGVSGMMRDFDEFGQYRTIGRGQGFFRGNNWYNYEMWDAKDIRHKQPNWWRMTDLVYNNKSLKGTPNAVYYGQHVVNQKVGLDSIRCWAPFSNKFIVPDNRVAPHGGHSDWYVFRVAETYLLRAEAYYWKGDLVNAANDINMVHTRAGCDPVSSSNVTIGTILDERAKELYCEEPRKCELTRIAYIFAKTGKTAYNGKTYSENNFSENNFFYDRIMEKNIFYSDHVLGKDGTRYSISSWNVLWPILSDVINANTLGHINQNKGYTGSENNIAPKVYPKDYSN
jgi:hypothetical protein